MTLMRRHHVQEVALDTLVGVIGVGANHIQTLKLLRRVPIPAMIGAHVVHEATHSVVALEAANVTLFLTLVQQQAHVVNGHKTCWLVLQLGYTLTPQFKIVLSSNTINK